MCSLWLNRNIMEPGRQFTRSCCKKLPRITVWWLASKVIASRSTSTVFCPKIFWVVIRNAFRNCVSNWKFWKSTHWVWLAAVAKKRFRRSGNSRPVYGPTPYASNIVVSNSQSWCGWLQLIGIWQIMILQSHTTSKTNSKGNVDGLGEKRLSAVERSSNLLKYALVAAFYQAAPALKTPPAGRRILESDNGYL